MSLPYIYTPNVPLGKEQINNTQQPINYNFQDIATLFAVNHVPFNTADDFGKHNFVTYYNQSQDPDTGSTDMAIFSKEVNGSLQLVYRYPDNGFIYPLTQPAYYPAAGSGGYSIATGYLSSGYFYLNGGMLCLMQSFLVTQRPSGSSVQTLQWNIQNPQSGANVGFTYPPFYLSVGIGYMAPNPNAPVQSGIVASTVLSNTDFSVTIENGGGCNIYAMAIGI